MCSFLGKFSGSFWIPTSNDELRCKAGWGVYNEDIELSDTDVVVGCSALKGEVSSIVELGR